MSIAKATVIENINHISDDLNEMEIVERLYMLMRLEHSRERCRTEGTIPDSELDKHFAQKRADYVAV